MNTTKERSSSILNTLRAGLTLRVAAGIGSAALLTGCASSTEASAPAEQPSASQPASGTPSPVETITSVEIIDTPEVDSSDTDIDSTDEAIALLSSMPPIDLIGSTADYQALIDAVNGDVAALDTLGVTINDIVANYELSRIYIGEVEKLVDGAEQELPAWSTNHTDGFSAVSTYDDVRATKYLLGLLISEYQTGNLRLKTLETKCPLKAGDGMTTTLPGGIDSTAILPPLSIFRFSFITETCTLDDLTNTWLNTYKDIPQIAIDFAPAGTPVTQQIFQVESDLRTLTNDEAVKIIENYSS